VAWLKLYYLAFYFGCINLELIALKMRLSYMGLLSMDLAMTYDKSTMNGNMINVHGSDGEDDRE
jgi:hypothetical protein